MTATLSRAILPLSGEPARLFSASAQWIALRRLSAVNRTPALHQVAGRRHHEEAVRCDGRQKTAVTSAVDRAAAVTQTISGSVSLPGNGVRSAGR